MTVALINAAGVVHRTERWDSPADDVDARVLEHAVSPVLDVGCGPGRHLRALAERGLPALGVDITPGAVARARGHGVAVLRRCVFDRVPGAGRYRTVLLLDGNLGIGDDPVALLRRCGELLAPGGRVLVEVPPDDAGLESDRVRLMVGATPGPWFMWRDVTAFSIPALVAQSEFAIAYAWRDCGRSFARLERTTHCGS